MSAAVGMERLSTSLLDIGFKSGGDPGAPVVLLLHGWPDDATTWDGVAPALQAAGFRTVAPWLRGFGPTRFHSERTLRDGRAEALAQDALDLMDGLGVARFSVAGHDWGARTAYALAAAAPERLDAIAGLSLAYSPRGAFPTPSFEQARAWWYQWLLCVDRGGEAVLADPRGFARMQWDTWSPPGWFDEATFEAVAESFDNPDFVEITLSSYRNRWRDEPRDPRYDEVGRRIAATATLATPTLTLQGGADRCALPEHSADKEHLFAGPYRRLIIDGVGHFPTREAPVAVGEALVRHLRESLAQA